MSPTDADTGHAPPPRPVPSVVYAPPLGGVSLLVVSGLSDDERQRLEKVVRRRVGPRSDAPQLVEAYLDAMLRNAFARTTDGGPVPTSLTVERSFILIEISRQLKRVIEDFEIQALFRVTLPSARAMRTTLLATYSDDAAELTLAWALRGARTGRRQRASSFTGTTVFLCQRTVGMLSWTASSVQE